MSNNPSPAPQPPPSGDPREGDCRPWETRRGLLVAVAAPSGAGKTTLCVRMTQRFPALRYAISCTTRPPRKGEVDGEHYHFVSQARFQEMVGGGEFLEWAVVHGHFYGTPKAEVDAMRDRGGDVLLDLDVQGVESIRSIKYIDAVFCLILPPTYAVLRERLGTRGKDSPEEIERRMTIAVKEIARYELFDYVIVNDDLEEAATQLESVIRAEHARRTRLNADWYRSTFFR
ncbi:MAG: guanylate kinase [Nitrospirota bacterium]|nr:guanylate kinase [Nitrospirota bacterium]